MSATTGSWLSRMSEENRAEDQGRLSSRFWRKARDVTLLMVSSLLCIMLAVIGVLFMSSNTPRPFLDANGAKVPGSISEKIYVTINGVEQGMFIKSRNAANPVLMYVHGGMPFYFLTEKYPTGLEDNFTMVWWDQRGAGLSYQANFPPETDAAEQLISDTIEVTNYLRRRFGHDKIYLMGHSGGTFLGIQAAARAPELYHAYIGVSQMTDQLKSEKLAYEFMLEQFKANGDRDMARKLEASPVTIQGGAPDAYLALRDGAMHGLGVGTMREMKSVISGIFLPSLTFPEYSLSDKINLWRGKIRTGVSVIWPTIMKTDLARKVPALAIPVYFLEGRHDYTCSYALAKDYFLRLKAPVKGFYTFEQSAHSPIFEEPAKAREIFRQDVLTGGVSLADRM
jgi:pimeloyl-ACP methyl ester carboxylesterase